MLWIVVILFLAAIIGFFTRRWVLGPDPIDPLKAEAEALPVNELVDPVRTLTALLLGFVLFSTYTSYHSAAQQAALEAGSVLAMGETAVLLTPAARRDVLSHVQCYARSVAGPDWRAQANPGQLSPITDRAADGITQALLRAGSDPRNSAVLNALLTDDRDRIQARIQRIEEGAPSVPTLVWALLLVTVAVMVGGMTALGHPHARARVQLGVAVLTVIAIGMTLFVILDLDHPYDGPTRIQPTAMLNAIRRMSDLPDGNQPLPCDAQGALQ